MVDPRVVIAPTGPDGRTRTAIARAAARRGFRRLLLHDGDAPPSEPGLEILRDRGDTWAHGPGAGDGGIPVRRVGSLPELEQVLRDLGGAPEVGLRWTDDRVIPLETLVARRPSPSGLWVVARTPEEVPAALGALERGADHVVCELSEVAQVERLVERLDTVELPSLDWEAVPVRRVEPAGMGDRVIVDTTSVLEPEEGLQVGSSAGFLFHVASEAEGSGFTRPRSFRVNAGAAHSYVLMADGSTRYLSELAPGDRVLAAKVQGARRTVRVGRLKVERRPLLLVEAERGDRRPTLFVQEAETVRVSEAPSLRVASTDLRPGIRIWGVALPPARHLGESVQETIEER